MKQTLKLFGHFSLSVGALIYAYVHRLDEPIQAKIFLVIGIIAGWRDCRSINKK